MKIKNIDRKFNGLYERWEKYLKWRYGNTDNMYNNTKNFLKDERIKCKEIDITENHLKNILSLRNVKVHTPSFVEIKENAVMILQLIINNFCRKASDIATPGEKIYKATPSFYIKDIIEMMAKNLYTHVPIIQGSKFIGIFSENTLLRLTVDNKNIDKLKIKDIQSYLKATEGTDAYEFLAADADFYKVHKLFQKYIDKNKRLGVIFLTNDGKKSGKIKGLITAWDLSKNQ